MSDLNQNDYNNILALLQRVTVQGLNEAQTLVVLAAKLQKAANPPVELEKPAKAKKAD